MVKNRIIYLIISLLLFICVIMFILFKSDILSVMVCTIGIVVKIVERILEHYNYHVLSIKIETIQNHAERYLTEEIISELQDLINERRGIPVLEINLIHKRNAKKYSTSYEETS